MKRSRTKTDPIVTRIGKCIVPVHNHQSCHILTFSGVEAGPYAFWTAVFKKAVGQRTQVWGRARVGLSAGDRFDRMLRESVSRSIPSADRKAYREMWQMMSAGKNVAYVRPSTLWEVMHWLTSHESDVVGADYVLHGKTYRPVVDMK